MKYRRDVWCVGGSMRVFKDGNAYCIVRDDFVNLQESPAVFFPEDSWQGKILAAHIDDGPALWLPVEELFNIDDILKVTS